MLKITTFVCTCNRVYNNGMKLFADVSVPVKLKTTNIKSISLLYTGVLTVFAVTQLFTFEDFMKIVSSYDLFNDELIDRLKAVFIVVAEVFALPFLLRMKVSWLMRIVSMISGWLAVIFWLGVSLWLAVGDNSATNIGFLGSVVELAPGWWAVFLSIGLGILSFWASWGMWPVKLKRK